MTNDKSEHDADCDAKLNEEQSRPSELWVADGNPPPRPQLQCPECSYHHDQPTNLALHLLEVHAYSDAQAWYVAGQENERLYPRFRSDEGRFCVLAVDYEQSQGTVIRQCSSLEEAVQLAHQVRGLYPTVSVYDGQGNELFCSKPFNPCAHLD